MLPGAWLGGGAPTGVLIETALAGLMVVPMVWWVARSIGGPAAGLSAGLLAATSGGLVGFSTFIWNPTLIEPGAALALLGAWQASSTRNPAWLLAAAAGTAVAMQAHITAGVIVVRMSMVLLALLWRGPAGQRRRIALWAVAAVALIVATYVPFILYEVGHDFAETRAILAFITGPGEQADHGPAYRLATSAVRILAWPLTGWPIWGGEPDRPVAIGVAGAFAGGLIWRLSATATPNRRRGGEAADDAIEASLDAADPHCGSETAPGSWPAAWVPVLVMGLGISSTSESFRSSPSSTTSSPTRLSSLRPASSWARCGASAPDADGSGRLAAFLALRRWPPQSSTVRGNGRPARTPTLVPGPGRRQPGHARCRRPVDRAIGLPDDRSTDAYGFPLVLDGATMATPDRATVLVVLCNASFSDTCGGPMEGAWLAVSRTDRTASSWTASRPRPIGFCPSTACDPAEQGRVRWLRDARLSCLWLPGGLAGHHRELQKHHLHS